MLLHEQTAWEKKRPSLSLSSSFTGQVNSEPGWLVELFLLVSWALFWFLQTLNPISFKRFSLMRLVKFFQHGLSLFLTLAHAQRYTHVGLVDMGITWLCPSRSNGDFQYDRDRELLLCSFILSVPASL